jgi:type VI secretion system lysozyme-like protein
LNNERKPRMDKIDERNSFVPSLLDRIVDRDLDGSGEEVNRDPPYHVTLRQFKRAVELDLEALFNTRQQPLEDQLPEFKEAKDIVLREATEQQLPSGTVASRLQRAREKILAEFKDIRQSLVTYGLPDFATFGADEKQLQRAMEFAIATFEPRLTRVRVEVEASDVDKYDRTLRFHIRAQLRVEPVPEPVSFDAVLRVDTQKYEIKGHD